jgi:hypothetical protein
MQIKVNINNMINLISNFLIRLRTEDNSGNVFNDLISFVEYLEKYSSANDDVLFDKNFVTSRNEKGRLDEVLNPNIPEIMKLKETLLKIKGNPTDNEANIEETKESLRKIVAALISLKNKPNY